MSPEKERLLELEKSGEYVFHGSAEKLSLLEPRQAYNLIKGANKKDGKPAVFASGFAECAIAMAVINRDNYEPGQNWRLSMGSDIDKSGKTSIKFQATKEALDTLSDDIKGWVHVLDIGSFKQRLPGSFQHVSYAKVEPLETIAVTKTDLPSNIEIIEN